MSSETSQSRLPETLPFMANGQKFMLAMARLNAQAFTAGMRYEIEVLDFLRHRFEKDMKLVEDLVARDEFADGFDIIADFMQIAVTEYTDEAGKIATIGSSFAAETVRGAISRTDGASEASASRTPG